MAIGSRNAGSVARYIGRGGEYTAELELDADGLVELYTGMARRVGEAVGAGNSVGSC